MYITQNKSEQKCIQQEGRALSLRPNCVCNGRRSQGAPKQVGSRKEGRTDGLMEGTDEGEAEILDNICIFGFKNSKNYIERKNLPENWIMGQNTPQAMGIGVLDTFMPHPGVITGPGVSKNWYSWGKNIAIMGGCRNGKT